MRTARYERSQDASAAIGLFDIPTSICREGLRYLLLLVTALHLMSCGALPKSTQEEVGATPVILSDALAACRNLYPDQIVMAVARADCIIKATTELVRPILPFPDLLDQENALRKLLAEQVQTGRISLLERNIRILKLHKTLIDQEEERLRVNPGAAIPNDPSVAQWRFSNHDGCGKLGGNNPNCY